MTSYAHQQDRGGPIDINNLFTYHAPSGDQQERYQRLRLAAKNLASQILDCCPPSADRSDALRSVRNAVMTANASIAIGEAGDTFKQQTSNHPEQYGPNAVTETRLTGQTGSGTGAVPAAEVVAETASTDPDDPSGYADNQNTDPTRPRGRAKAGVL